jgi:hypothetical protein
MRAFVFSFGFVFHQVFPSFYFIHVVFSFSVLPLFTTMRHHHHGTALPSCLLSPTKTKDCKRD